MQRRDFLAASAAATALATQSQLANAAAPAADARQYIEWRTYRLASADKQPLVEKHLEAALPAWQRIGLGPVGVFKEIPGEGATETTPSIHALLIYPTLDKFAAAREALEHDADYQKAAADYLAATKADPAFQRIDSWLMIAFAGFPQPQKPANPKPTVYELRTYESHGEERARKKIDMFNGGEIEIFPKCSFQEVFFGEALVGASLPHLKYMLATPDMAANVEGWKKFRVHPDWVAVKDKPEFKDAVSKVSRMYLEAMPYSQV